MTKAQRIKEMKSEIEWYDVNKRIANAMLELAEIGFEFSGHGCGGGGEDFSIFKDGKLHVNFCDKGRNRVDVIVSKDDDDMDVVFKGTIGGALKYIKKA
jgi:hypothetical protein